MEELNAFGLTDFLGIVLVIGAVMRFIVKNERARAWGTAAIIQSSSATMGIVIVLAGQGPIMMGAGR